MVMGQICCSLYIYTLQRYIGTIHLIEQQGCDTNLHIKQVAMDSKQLGSITNALSRVLWSITVMCQHTEVWININSCRRQWFKMHCCIMLQIAPKFCPQAPINNYPVLVQIMACCQSDHLSVTQPLWSNRTTKQTSAEPQSAIKLRALTH